MKKKYFKFNKKSLLFDFFNFKDSIHDIKEEYFFLKKNFNIKKFIKIIIIMIISCILASIGFYYFVNSSQFYNNGLSGIAQLITKTIFLQYENSDPGFFNQMRALYYYPIFVAINLPFIIWGIFKLGIRFSLLTIFYMTLTGLLITFYSKSEFFKDFSIFSKIIDNSDELTKPFIFATLGGLIYGTSLGLLFKTGGSTSGLDYVSSYISIKRNYSIAKLIANINISVVIFSIFIDGVILHKANIIDTYTSTPLFLANIIYIYISSFIMNRVYPKYMMITVFIISSEIPKIREYIYSNNYLRGGNLMKVKGLYSGKEYDMIMTTMSLLEYNFLKNKLIDVDKNLFMVTLKTNEISGGKVASLPKLKVIKEGKNDE